MDDQGVGEKQQHTPTTRSTDKQSCQLKQQKDNRKRLSKLFILSVQTACSYITALIYFAAIPELTLSILTKELKILTNPTMFAVFLSIPVERIQIIHQDNCQGNEIHTFLTTWHDFLN